MIDYKELIHAGTVYGHETRRRHPKMTPYIWGIRSGVHLIDVSKTALQMEKAAKFLERVIAGGKQVLWVGTKKSAQKIIRQAADTLDMAYVTTRWVGGTLSNHSQVKKSVTNLLHFEDVIAKSGQFPYTKKELNTIQKKVDRLRHTVGGIRKLKLPLGALVLVDVRKERTALREARVLGIPVIAIVDTNSDPTGVDVVIPANDDSPKSIALIINYLLEAANKGREAEKKQAEKRAKEKAAEAAKKKEEREKKVAAAAEARAAAKAEAAKKAAEAKPKAKPAPKKAEVAEKKTEKKAAAPKKEEKKEVKATPQKKTTSKAEAVTETKKKESSTSAAKKKPAAKKTSSTAAKKK